MGHGLFLCMDKHLLPRLGTSRLKPTHRRENGRELQNAFGVPSGGRHRKHAVARVAPCTGCFPLCGDTNHGHFEKEAADLWANMVSLAIASFLDILLYRWLFGSISGQESKWGRFIFPHFQMLLYLDQLKCFFSSCKWFNIEGKGCQSFQAWISISF